MSEKLCLQWNDFKDNAISAFGNLREDKDFADVTLACEDGKQLEVHTVILASSSPFFKNILQRNRHTYPMIYMRGVKSEDLIAIVDFLYCGEANVYQDNLDSFLAIAEELQLKGLIGKSENYEVIEKANMGMAPQKKANMKKANPVHKKEAIFLKSESNLGEQIFDSKQYTVQETIPLPNNFSEDLQELDKASHPMMEKTASKKYGLPLYKCQVCDKEAKIGDMKRHIERKHLEGVSIPCNFCDKTFRCRNTLAVHNRRIHKDH